MRRLAIASVLVLCFVFGCAQTVDPLLKLDYITPSVVDTGEPVCNSNGWKGIDPERWEEMSRPDGESFGCDYPNLPLECAVEQECDNSWQLFCDIYSGVDKPLHIVWWTMTGPNRTWHDPNFLAAQYYPCVYYCLAWVWTTTKCKQQCPDGDECCMTTCNNFGTMRGDADGDGDVDLADYAILQRYIGSGGLFFGQESKSARSSDSLLEFLTREVMNFSDRGFHSR